MFRQWRRGLSSGLWFGLWGALGGAVGGLLGEFVPAGGRGGPVAAVLLSAVWFGLVAGCIAAALTSADSWRRGEKLTRLPAVARQGAAGGAKAGLLAGALAQYAFASGGATDLLRIAAWGIAGGLLGLLLGRRIRGLSRRRGLLGGVAGGLLGGLLFIWLSPAAAGDPSRRADAAFAPEFRSRLQREGGRSGEVQVTLIWDNFNDIDLHVIAPSGQEIWYGGRHSRCGGWLDVDQNVTPQTNQPVENVFWPKDGAPSGTYQVYVHHFNNHGGAENRDPTRWRVATHVGGRVSEYRGRISSGDDPQFVTAFTHPPGGGAGGLLAGRETGAAGRLWGVMAIGFAIGLMIWLLDALLTKAWLEIHSGKKQAGTVGLGQTPVSIGGDPAQVDFCCGGSLPVAWRFRIDGAQVIGEDLATGWRGAVPAGRPIPVGSLTVTVCTGDAVGPPAAASGPSPSPAPPAPAVPQPVASPVKVPPPPSPPVERPVFWLELAGGRRLPLGEGVSLTLSDLTGGEPTPGEPAVAEVHRHPEQPELLGLRNVGTAEWRVVTPAGKATVLPPGRNMRLADGAQVTVGSATGRVSDQTGTDPQTVW